MIHLLTLSKDVIVSLDCFGKSRVKLLELLLAMLRLNEVVELDLVVNFKKGVFMSLK